MSVDIRYPLSHYDYNKDWEYDHHGWHKATCVLNGGSLVDVSDQIQLLLKWVHENIQNYKKHCIWETQHLFHVPYNESYTVNFKFRYERDYTWFILTWG